MTSRSGAMDVGSLARAAPATVRIAVIGRPLFWLILLAGVLVELALWDSPHVIPGLVFGACAGASGTALWTGLVRRRDAEVRGALLDELAAEVDALAQKAPGTLLASRHDRPEAASLVAAVNAAIERHEASLSVLRRFTWDAAHQLKTPLAVLSARLTDGSDRVEVEHVRRDLQWMSRLVGQLLTAARASETRLDPEETFDLGAVGAEVVAGLFPLAVFRQRDLELIDFAGRPVLVRGSAPLAFEALSNLVENALSHTPPDTPVSVVVHPSGLAEVLDHGPGVPSKDRERIFKRFEQGPSPTAGGAGLGLSIVAEIMSRHGGMASYRDRDGGGAAFGLQFKPIADRTP